MSSPDWQQTLRALDVGVVIQARDLSIVYANPKATAMLGITADEITARTTDDARWDVIAADGTPFELVDHPGPRALHTGEPIRGVILGVRRGDSPERAWLQVSAIPERSSAGVIERVIITLADVSDAHREYREQDALYRSVFRSMSEGLVIHAPDGSIRAANEAAERVLGLTVDQMAGRAATDPRWRLVTTDGAPADAAVIPSEIARRTGQAAGETILGVARPSGALAWLDVRADPIFDAGESTLRGVVATFTDVTTERETMLALESSRVQIQRVLDAVPGVVYQFLRPTAGPDELPFLAGRIRELLGVDPAVALADPMRLLSTLVGPSEQHALFAHIDATVATQGTFDYVVSATMPDGGRRWLRVHGLPERTAKGLLYTGVILDVTEEQRMAEALRRRQRREAMGDMAAGIAHNFNNMLAVILPSLEMAHDEASVDTRAALADAARAASSAADLVRRMLALGRMEPPATDTPVDLSAITREAVHICRQTFDRGITIVDEIELPAAFVGSRASDLQQVVLNLCLNARDAMIGVDAGRLLVRIEAAGEYAVSLLVQDTGHGMSEATLHRIGEPFFTTKLPGRGTGLGLASAFHCITEAGGSWRVESVVGTGTTFHIQLPLVAAHVSETVPAPAAPSFPEGVVLLVDDEPMVRTAIARQLTRGGLRVETAESAEQALAWLQDARTDRVLAIVLDVSMPGMSGVQALPLIRALAPAVPVISMSGHVPDVQALAGAALILQKPISGRDLLLALQSVIG